MMQKGVAMISEYDDFIYFRTMCGCSACEHDQNVQLSISEEGILDLTIYSNYEHVVDCQYDSPWYMEYWRRIKSSMQLLFTGYLSMNAGLTFDDADHLECYIDGLQDGLDKLKQKK